VLGLTRTEGLGQASVREAGRDHHAECHVDRRAEP
jgi:hypothetical protein